MTTCRNDWSLEEVKNLYHSKLFPLLMQAMQTHQMFHNPLEMQVCSLISIKTGGCPEDCKYCAQSAHYSTPVKAEPLLTLAEVKKRAEKALKEGASRICLGAAWKKVRDSAQFDAVLEMISELKKLGAEVCCCLGTLNQSQALKLKSAGLYAYNHNIDTSRHFYPNIITTRTYDKRLETLDIVRKAKLTLCCGGILGLGESKEDRISFLHTLCTLNPHPESVPINILHRIKGTPLSDAKPLDYWELLRTIASARLLMPKATIRLSAGRMGLSEEQQALCFLAGANSLWLGEKLLTVPNCSTTNDTEMFERFGFIKRTAYANHS